MLLSNKKLKLLRNLNLTITSPNDLAHNKLGYRSVKVVFLRIIK